MEGKYYKTAEEAREAYKRGEIVYGKRTTEEKMLEYYSEKTGKTIEEVKKIFDEM